MRVLLDREADATVAVNPSVVRTEFAIEIVNELKNSSVSGLNQSENEKTFPQSESPRKGWSKINRSLLLRNP